MDEKQQQKVRSTLTIQIILGFVFLSILAINGFFVYKNHVISNWEIELNLTHSNQKKLIKSINELVYQSINDSNFVSKEIPDLINEFSEGTSKIIELNSEIGEPINASNSFPISNIETISHDYVNLVKLVITKRIESFHNKVLIKSRLTKITENYTDITEANLIGFIEHSSYYNNLNFIIKVVSMLLMIVLAIAIHFLLFVPVNKVNKNLSVQIESDHSQLNQQGILVKETKEKEALTNSLLKVKSAQVLKLQESLELAIAFSNKTLQDKNLIYFNMASDLSEFIKVLSLQKKIIENQTSLYGNENWTTLSNTISQLNSLAGNYFNLSKNGQNNQQNGEVYLTQLMSEILVSVNDKATVNFEIVSDLPTIKTDIELLKRVLTPYINLMSLIPNKGVIKYSAKEDSSNCEIKFIGLKNEFKEQLDELENKQLSNFSFEEFKVHMAKKSILERGGKCWMQFDSGDKGVFTIIWPL